MIKNMMNYFFVSAVLLSLNQVFAEELEPPKTVAEEANQIKEEINAASEQLLQSYLNDPEITGKKKERGVRVLNQVKIKDENIQKFLNDTEISEDQKAKLLKKLKKVVSEAKAKSGTKSADADTLSVDFEASSQED